MRLRRILAFRKPLLTNDHGGDPSLQRPEHKKHDTHKHTPYCYTALDTKNDEIRLIRLAPGKFNDIISFEIVHAPLRISDHVIDTRLSVETLQGTVPEGWCVKQTLEHRYFFFNTKGPHSWTHPNAKVDRTVWELPRRDDETKLKFEALSYTWGSPDNPVAARVLLPSSSKRDHATLPIGHNLAEALRSLRYHNRMRVLWVDAVCINQEDLQERSAQVKRMADIYSLAAHVVVWVGPEADESGLALTTLEDMGNQVEVFSDLRRSRAPRSREADWWSASIQLPFPEKTWSALLAFIRRSWFQRVWVLQEIRLASSASVVCGEVSVSAAAMIKAILVLGDSYHTPYQLSGALSWYRIGLFPMQMLTFPKLLLWTAGRQCTDPRDRIYGILGLTPQSISQRIVPDYSASIQDVYKSAFLIYVDIFKRWDLLRRCRLAQAISDAPSWVPNWGAKFDGYFFGDRIANLRQASGLSAAHATNSTSDALEAVGVHVATISSVGRMATSDPAQDIFILREWEPPDLATSNYVTGGPLLDAFVEVVFQGRTSQRFPGSPFPPLEKRKDQYLQYVSVTKLSHPIDPDVMKIHNTLEIEASSLIATTEGYLGVAPPFAKEGDFVCILLGCNMPMLLRPCATGDFRVVAPCFVHGIMDAESLLGPLPKPWISQLQIVDACDVLHFFNVDTNELLLEDPRLPPLPSGWEETGRKPTSDDPRYFKEFHNRDTGRVINSDPRMMPDALRARGVVIRAFRLV
ncbi:HET-domain-containing protein [Lophiostoma macrostomum CBS 122681]|uniref:HET-domain-containing protein n=1 Tax=Lophiostoma macrostomum CBS 122681 TaxID=1314788 RepID=A0A6A6SQB4_9PLEO|nr:HET-domain-containing protein [Lophiostoma macrostomum CBS 122681]